MTASAPVLVAQAPPGTPATCVPARTRNDLRTVAVVAPPGPRSHIDLPLDLLAALGKHEDVAGRSSHSQDDTTLIPLWLRAHRTEWIVVTSPHVLPTPTLHLLPTLTVPSGARLLLACDPGTARSVTDRLREYGPAEITWADVPGLVPPPDPPARPADEPAGEWTERDLTLPREDWPTFRSECRRLLHPDTFTPLDHAYQQAFRTCRAWLRTNTPDENATADTVGRAVGQAASLDLAVTVLRACQAAHMEAGWYLRVDLEQAIRALSERPAVLTDTQWRSLRAYRNPHRPAAVALHQHQLSVQEMHALTLNQVTPDGTAVNDQPVDPRASAYLRAQRLHRQAEGATGGDPYLPHEPRRTVDAIRDARADLSLLLGTGRLSGTEHPDARWQRRLGLRLWDLR